MSEDEKLSSLLATLEVMQLRLDALEATVTDDPESREKFEAFLRTAEKRILLEQQNPLHSGTLFQTKKPN